MFGPHDQVPTHLTSGIGKGQTAALCIYYGGDTASITIAGSDLILTDGVTVHTIDLTGRSSTQIAGDITKSATSYTARVLFDVDNLLAATPSITTGDVSADGGQIVRVLGHAVLDLTETAFRLLPPYLSSRAEPWYPLVTNGSLVKHANGSDWVFSIPEYEHQPWSVLFGKPYVDMTKVSVSRPTDRVLALPRTPVFYRKSNVYLYVNDQLQSTSIVSDVDEFNGFVYLTKTFDDSDEIKVSYTYEEKNYSYRGVDLNPTELHNPAMLGRYVVVYLMPYSGGGGVVRGNTIYHQESNSLLGAVASIPKTDEPILILGAYHVSPGFKKEDVNVVDTRTVGGGVKRSSVQDALSRNEEVWSTTDTGHYDGLPYPGGGAITISVPASIREVLDEARSLGYIKKYAAMGTHIFTELRT